MHFFLILVNMKEEVAIYKKLKALRKERGLTLATLADRIGSDYQQLSRIERGKSRLTVDVLMKMADEFDTPIDELVKGSALKQPVSKPALLASTSAISEEKLGEILEKLDVLTQQENVSLRPQVKASLASIIYKEAHKNPAAIDFAISIIRTILSS